MGRERWHAILLKKYIFNLNYYIIIYSNLKKNYFGVLLNIFLKISRLKVAFRKLKGETHIY